MENIAEIAAWVFAIASAIVTCAKAITVATPTQVDDRVFAKAAPFINPVLRAINWAALNIGKDKNADDKPAVLR